MGAGHSGGILRPSGAGVAFLHLPSACALGCNISPLRGWTEKFACAEVRGKAETSGAEARLLFRDSTGTGELVPLPSSESLQETILDVLRTEFSAGHTRGESGA